MWLTDYIKNYSKTDKIAQIYNEDILTYKELEKRSDSLACYIINNNENNKPIIIYGHKNNQILICFLAAMKAGCAYIPIDITFPKERVYDIRKNSDSNIVFNFSDEELGFNNKVNIIESNRLKEIFQEFNGQVPEEKKLCKKDDLVYILYTSGSTGKPKGVKITRTCIENFINWFKDKYMMEESNGSIMNQVSYSFDVSVMSTYISLCLGKTLYVVDKQMLNNFKLLFENLQKSNLGLWISTPSLLEMCLTDESFNEKLLPNLQKIILAGEVLNKKLASKVFERFPKIKLINGYGPTEATVLVTATYINNEMILSNESLPIGKQGDNILLKIKDNEGNEIREDLKKGELHILGESVADGYYNNPENTSKSFYKAHVDGKELKAYKTGDIVYKKQGLFYYNGRKDFQVKLNGFRIELQDIENNLLKIDFVENAIVLPVKQDNKITHLCAFVKLNRKFDCKNFKIVIKIKEELSKLIPVYMVPRKIKIKEEFKLNTNGKIDRKALLEDM